MTYAENIDFFRWHLPFEDILNHFNVKTRTGNGDKIRAHCPWHKDRTPSLGITQGRPGSPSRFHCFSCHESGSIISFIMRHEGMNFKEAYTWLCDFTGRGYGFKDSTTKEKQEPIHNLILKYLEKQNQERNYKKTVKWSKSRGFDQAFLKKHNISVGSLERITDVFKTRKEDLLAAGLVTNLLPLDAENQEYLPIVDEVPFFRGERAVFTFHDVNGKIIGFGARALESIQKPKFLFQSNFPKASFLYMSNIVSMDLINKQHLKGEDYHLFVVEGPLDALRLWEQGLKAVAVMGSYLTHPQIETLRNLSARASRAEINLVIHLFFDNDNAGFRGMYRSVKNLFESKAQIFPFDIIQLKDKDDTLDPDKWGLIQKGTNSKICLNYFQNLCYPAILILFSERLGVNRLADVSTKLTNLGPLAMRSLFTRVSNTLSETALRKLITSESLTGFRPLIGDARSHETLDRFQNFLGLSIPSPELISQPSGPSDKKTDHASTAHDFFHALELARQSVHKREFPFEWFTWERIRLMESVWLHFFKARLSSEQFEHFSPMNAIYVPKSDGRKRLMAMPCPEDLILQQYFLNELLKESKYSFTYTSFIPAVRYISENNMESHIKTTGLTSFKPAYPETVSFAYQVNMNTWEADSNNSEYGIFRRYYDCWQSFLIYIKKRARRMNCRQVFVSRLDISAFYDNITRTSVERVLVPCLEKALDSHPDWENETPFHLYNSGPSSKASDKAVKITNWLCDASFGYSYHDPCDGTEKKHKPEDRGIPQGPGLSAYLANIALFPFDRAITQIIHTWESENEKIQHKRPACGVYARYVDDIVIVSRTEEELNILKASIQKQLATIGLGLNTKQESLNAIDMQGIEDWLEENRGGGIFSGAAPVFNEDYRLPTKSMKLTRKEALGLISNPTMKNNEERLLTAFEEIKHVSDFNHYDRTRIACELWISVLSKKDFNYNNPKKAARIVTRRWHTIMPTSHTESKSSHLQDTLSISEFEEFLPLLEGLEKLLLRQTKNNPGLSRKKEENTTNAKKNACRIISKSLFETLTENYQASFQNHKVMLTNRMANLLAIAIHQSERPEEESRLDYHNHIHSDQRISATHDALKNKIPNFTQWINSSFKQSTETNNLLMTRYSSILLRWIEIPPHSFLSENPNMLIWWIYRFVDYLILQSRTVSLEGLQSDDPLNNITSQERGIEDNITLAVLKQTISNWQKDSATAMENHPSLKSPKALERACLDVFISLAGVNLGKLLTDRKRLSTILFEEEHFNKIVPLYPGVNTEQILLAEISQKTNPTNTPDSIKIKAYSTKPDYPVESLKELHSANTNFQFRVSPEKTSSNGTLFSSEKTISPLSGFQNFSQIANFYRWLFKESAYYISDCNRDKIPVPTSHHLYCKMDNNTLQNTSYIRLGELIPRSEVEGKAFIRDGQGLKSQSINPEMDWMWRIGYVISDILGLDDHSEHRMNYSNSFSNPVCQTDPITQSALYFAITKLKGRYTSGKTFSVTNNEPPDFIQRILERLELLDSTNHQIPNIFLMLDLLSEFKWMAYAIELSIDWRSPGACYAVLQGITDRVFGYFNKEQAEALWNRFFITETEVPEGLRRTALSWWRLGYRLDSAIQTIVTPAISSENILFKLHGLKALSLGLWAKALSSQIKGLIIDILSFHTEECEVLHEKTFDYPELDENACLIVSPEKCQEQDPNENPLDTSGNEIFRIILSQIDSKAANPSFQLSQLTLSGWVLGLGGILGTIPLKPYKQRLPPKGRPDSTHQNYILPVKKNDFKQVKADFKNLLDFSQKFKDFHVSTWPFHLLPESPDWNANSIKQAFISINHIQKLLNITVKNSQKNSLFNLSQGANKRTLNMYHPDKGNIDLPLWRATYDGIGGGLEETTIGDIRYPHWGESVRANRILSVHLIDSHLSSYSHLTHNSKETSTRTISRSVSELRKLRRRIQKPRLASSKNFSHQKENSSKFRFQDHSSTSYLPKNQPPHTEKPPTSKGIHENLEIQLPSKNNLKISSTTALDTTNLLTQAQKNSWSQRGKARRAHVTRVALFQFPVDDSYESPNQEVCKKTKFKHKMQYSRESFSLGTANDESSCAEYRRRKLIEKALEICNSFEVDALLLPEYSVRPETVAFIQDLVNKRISARPITVWAGTYRAWPNNTSWDNISSITISPFSSVLPIITSNEAPIVRLKKYPAEAPEECFLPTQSELKPAFTLNPINKNIIRTFEPRSFITELICSELFVMSQIGNYDAAARKWQDLLFRFGINKDLTPRELKETIRKDIENFSQSISYNDSGDLYPRRTILFVPAMTNRTIDYALYGMNTYLTMGLTTAFCNASLKGFGKGRSCFIGYQSWKNLNQINHSFTSPYHDIFPGIFQNQNTKDYGPLGENDNTILIADIDPVHTKEVRPQPQFLSKPLTLVAHIPILETWVYNTTPTTNSKQCRCQRANPKIINQNLKTLINEITNLLNKTPDQNHTGTQKNKSTTLKLLNKITNLFKEHKQDHWLRQREIAFKERSCTSPRQWPPPCLIDWTWVDMGDPEEELDYPKINSFAETDT